ncbi:MAG TPA: arginase family protein [Ktedonobacteraceae bacterium]
MTTIQLIAIPYDSGHRGERMGAGPEYFLSQSVDEILRRQGWTINVETVEAQHLFRAEIGTAFELCRSLAQRVRRAQEQGAFPLILSGNCNSCLGTLSGIDSSTVGIIWFDAHGDFNTPETTTEGFLDGMGLATATGHCWTTLAMTIPGFAAIPDDQVLLVGVRQLDPAEQTLLEQSQVMHVRGEQVRAFGLQESLARPLRELRSRVRRVYVHIDLDVLDPQVGQANSYAEPNGLSLPEMEQAITLIARQFVIAASALTAYDPTCDPEGKIFRAGTQLMEHMIRQIESSQGVDHLAEKREKP